MKQLVLLAQADAAKAPENPPQNAVIAHWNSEQAPPGESSIPDLLRSMLLQIRGEHMRWAYAMGSIAIGPGGETLAAELECGDRPSLWWTSLIYERHPRLSPHLYDVYKLRCLELLLQREGCDALLLHGGTARLRQVLAEFCKAAGIKFEARGPEIQENSENSGLTARVYAKTPAAPRALARFVHWWWTIRRKLPFCGKLAHFPPGDAPEELKTATIATYFPNLDLTAAAKGRFRSNYWQDLHDALNAEAKRERPRGPHFVRWLFIRFPAPHLDLRQCIKLRDDFQKSGEDGFSFHYLEEFLTTSDLWAALGRWRRVGRAAARAEEKARPHFHFNGSKINFWPYMRAEWRESFQGWRCLERCLHNRAFGRYVKMAGPQRWTLFPLENCPWERMLTLAGHELSQNGPVYGAQHSTIRPTDFRYFDDPRTFAATEWRGMQPDVVCGNGNSAINQWLASGVPKERLKQVEALRYLYLQKEKMENSAAAPAPQNQLPPEPGEPLEMPARYRLLVVTSFFADETRDHLDLLKKSLRTGLLQGWGITIKPHPYLAVEAWLEGLAPELRAQITIVDGPLALQLKPGAAVWASNSTTAALEAAIENLAVMVMWPRNDFDLCPIQNIPGLLRTGCLRDVERALQNLRPADPGADYLDLNMGLTAWRALLGLKG